MVSRQAAKHIKRRKERDKSMAYQRSIRGPCRKFVVFRLELDECARCHRTFAEHKAAQPSQAE